ncbi:Sel1 repeat-containing protein [Nocardiopsis sp. Huas11]|uniref:tetratricopeptide repeat protein n=1 Tax=Nocardiopsis sp. Huas11 TaxID=2183912 RepID=UPI000F17C62A|nr:tetratricopeptide repeat protein [Nocardiopsis sp. Huas11]RKS10310.1 Sel1 repeat-containing protein [Nocardiopsis sp. Huas11]
MHRSRFGAGGHSPHVRREVDGPIAEALRDDGRRVVLVSGPRLAGSTRALAHGAHEVLGDHPVVAFLDDPDVELAAMVAEAGALSGASGVTAPGTVLWIDRLSARRYAELARTDAARLPDGLRILAVADSALVRGLRVPAEAEAAMRAHGAPIELGPMTEAERRRLRAGTAYADPGLQARLDADDGTLLLGRLLVDLAPFHADLLPGTSTNRTALLRAVTDWRRVDPPSRLVWDDLERLYRAYREELTGAPQSAGVSAIGCEAALKWASRPTRERPALVEERSDQSGTYYSPHPLLAAIADESGQDCAWPVADPMWEHGDTRFEGEARRDIGYAAIEAKALTAAQRLLSHTDTRMDPVVLLYLGQVLMDSGDLDAARHWFTRVADQGGGAADTVPLAYFVLGGLEDARDDAEAARRWWALAIESGHPEWAPEAMVSLGELDWRQGDTDSARRWWIRAAGVEAGEGRDGGSGPDAPGSGPAAGAGGADTGASDAAAAAMYNLAVLEHRTGDRDAARAWYTHASASGVVDVAAKAMVDLGTLDRDRGDIEGARAWWGRAVRSGDPTAAPRARARLEALDRVDVVAERPVEPDGSAPATVESVGRPVETGDSAAVAEQPAEQLVGPEGSPAATPEPVAEPVGAGASGEPVGATAPEETAVHDAPGFPTDPQALLDLGESAAARGEADTARDLLTRAAESGDPHAAPRAMNALGAFEEDQGEIHEARGWYIRAVKTKDADLAPRSLLELGRLDHRQGWFENARTWFGHVVRTGHADAAPHALYLLAHLEQDQDETDEARQWFTRAAESGHTQWAPRAMLDLGELEDRRGDTEAARSWWRRAAGSGHADAAARADQALHDLGHPFDH